MLRFFKGQGHQRHFLLVKGTRKGHPMRKLYISSGAFEGHQGNDQYQAELDSKPLFINNPRNVGMFKRLIKTCIAGAPFT